MITWLHTRSHKSKQEGVFELIINNNTQYIYRLNDKCNVIIHTPSSTGWLLKFTRACWFLYKNECSCLVWSVCDTLDRTIALQKKEEVKRKGKKKVWSYILGFGSWINCDHFCDEHFHRSCHGSILKPVGDLIQSITFWKELAVQNRVAKHKLCEHKV